MRKLLALALALALATVAVAVVPTIAKSATDGALFTVKEVTSGKNTFKSADPALCRVGTVTRVAGGASLCVDDEGNDTRPGGCKEGIDWWYDVVEDVTCRDGSGAFAYRHWGEGPGGPRNWVIVEDSIVIQDPTNGGEDTTVSAVRTGEFTGLTGGGTTPSYSVQRGKFNEKQQRFSGMGMEMFNGTVSR